MFHSRDSPRLLVCDAGVYLEQNDKNNVSLLLQFVVGSGINTLDYSNSEDKLSSKGHINICRILTQFPNTNVQSNRVMSRRQYKAADSD